MGFPGRVALVEFPLCHKPLFHELRHAVELEPLVLYIAGAYEADDFSGVGELQSEAQKFDTVLEWVYPGFIRVQS